MCLVTGKQLKMLSHETVHRNLIKVVATENSLNREKCLITMYIVSSLWSYYNDNLSFVTYFGVIVKLPSNKG